MSNLPVISIAIVDGHNMVREGIIRLIHALGSHFKVYIDASRGKELLAKITDAGHLPDVCIVGLSMPEMDGYETMQAINKQWPGVKAIALSMHDGPHPILRALKCGAVAFISKSATGEALRDAINDVYSYGYHFSELVLKEFPKMNIKNVKEHTKKTFSDKEIRYLELCCMGLSYEQIGKEMNMSVRTAEKYCGKLRDSLNIHSRIELAIYALHTGVVKYKGGNTCIS